jgi:hypothetical protein
VGGGYASTLAHAKKARTLDGSIIAASPELFRFGASANYARACLRALRCRGSAARKVSLCAVTP